MGRLVQTKLAPKGACAHFCIRERPDAPLNVILTWLQENANGTVWWSKVLSRDPNGPRRADNRKRNFTDGTWSLLVWFAKKEDAALFRIFWDA